MNNELKINALFKDYDTRVREIEITLQRYHKTVAFVQTYLISISSFSSYVYFTNPKFFEESLKNGSHDLEIAGTLSFLTFFLFFLYVSMMDTVYMLFANGFRVAALEKIINENIKEDIMIWESKIIPFVAHDKWWVVNGAIRPQPLVFLWTTVLFLFSIILLCFFCYKYSPKYFGLYVVPTIFLSMFHLWQWLQLSLFNIPSYLRNSIFNLSSLDNLKEWDVNLPRYLIAPITIIFGFFIFCISAIQTDTFFPSNIHPFGLLSVPSIFIGDLILLPILNRKIYDSISSFSNTQNYKKSNFIIISFVMLVISTLIMGYLHYYWITDQYTGFMDLELGKLSFAGWWHFIFSSIELTAILILAHIGFVAYINKLPKVLSCFLKAWSVVVIFSSISILDLIFKIYLLNIGGITLSSIIPFVIALIIYFLANKSIPANKES